MKRPVLLLSAAACVAALAAGAPVCASAAAGHANQLVILATTDLKGKTGPCGCHTPKGGLSRRAFFRDSVAKIYSQLSMVDNGNFFPVEDAREDEAWFVMDMMMKLGVDAVGTGESDLRFGLEKLKSNVERTHLPMTSANLVDPSTHAPVLAPYVLKKVGTTKVGYFSLLTPKAVLSAAGVGLEVAEPEAAAKKTIAELRKQGASVVVLLSQLGNVESEDLVTMVPGIDVVICGRNAPVLAKGKMFNSTIASYPGDQGHYLGVTTLTLAAGKVKTRESVTVQLGPEIRDRADVFDMVKTFDTALNARIEKEKPATPEGRMGQPLQSVPTPTGGGR